MSNAEGNKCVSCAEGIYSSFEKKCIKCPDFTDVNSRSSGCHILDIAHNKAFRMRYFLKGLKRKTAENCEDNNELCYNKFIGPVRDHKNNDIFYISFSEKGKQREFINNESRYD